ncbi:MAG: acyl carrier protein [Planctomycetota bacterium]|nr:MAG: acyl carrier protein [Planctomycetota bacterium]
MMRAAVVCPGRGSYGRAELGWLGRAEHDGAPAVQAREQVLAALDALRAARGLEPLRALDGAEAFSARLHLRADHASALIFACSATDLGLVRAAAAAGALRPVVVCGNSLGWYTALFAAGALSLPDAARLVDTMAAIQVERGLVGGQLVYPVVEEQSWRPDPVLEGAVAEALEAAGAAGKGLWVSIRLGGSVVLGGEEAALRLAAERLPPLERGGTRFPLRLAGHSAFHTRLMEPMAAEAAQRLAGLGWRAPELALVDGRGFVWRPLHADPRALAAYTLGAQVTTTYDFTLSLRVALREYAPDVLVLLGPGDTIGGPVGQTLVREGWNGIRTRADFAARQRGERPIVLSLGRPAERARVRAAAAALATAG